MNEDQYPIVEARRLAFNGLLWNVPGLTIAAEAFLFGVVFSEATPPIIAMFLGLVSVIVALASLQFFVRLRWLEVDDSVRLERFVSTPEAIAASYENIHQKAELIAQHPMRGLSRFSSYQVWLVVLGVIVVVALAGTAYGVARVAGYTLSGTAPATEVVDPH